MTLHLAWAAAAFAVHLAAAIPARVQAWLPEKGEGTVSIGYQHFFVPYHLRLDGKAGASERGNININNVVLETTYGVTRKVALDLGIPYIASKYGGNYREGPKDNDKYYTTFQDFRVGARYALWERGITVTPSVHAIIPSHRYVSYGHVAPGRGLRELDLGINVGATLAPILPKTYFHSRYSYAVVQHVVHDDLDLNLNRSNFDLEAGHYVTRSLSIRAFGNWQRTHGGLEWTVEEIEGAHAEIHDKAARASYFRAGAGAAYSIHRSWEIYAAVITTLSGKNTHQIQGFTFGVTWSFARGEPVVGN